MHGGDDGAGFGDGEGDYILELAELELGADFFISGDDFLGTRDLLRRAKDGRLRGCTGGALFGRHGCRGFWRWEVGGEGEVKDGHDGEDGGGEIPHVSAGRLCSSAESNAANFTSVA